MMERILPAAVALLCAGASTTYFYTGDWRHGLVWAGFALTDFALLF